MDLVIAIKEQMEYCNQYDNYRCGIYVKRRAKARIVMDVISNLLPVPNREIELRMNNSTSEAIYKNGSIIRVVSANDCSRGQRFNGVIIDNETDDEVIDCVIMPVLMPLMDKCGIYSHTDNPMKRYCITNISADEVDKSKRFKEQVIYSNVMIKKFEPINFKEEYIMEFFDQNKSRKLLEKELNGDKVIFYDATGIPKENITYETEFVNKTKQTYLNVKGKNEFPELDFEKEIDLHIHIDTDIYDGYEVNIFDGIISVVLHEIVNEKPILKDYSYEKFVNSCE